ncbi:MAG: adenylate/guanylate cyclase domain-containing protein [Burkholderiales bacterium PBB4]|nr:MAG: adenylate/guanylate cyclase domain-containing protein [Burkholderiales bacterium PBB4]
MGVHTTVVFTDLHGSTAVFEALGNSKATALVTEITQGIGRHCIAHGGRVVKTLGDGVLAVFPVAQHAVDAVVEIQRAQLKGLLRGAKTVSMPIRIGVASGEVEVVQGDCYGDAVNVASRLCDLCGPNQIWANDAALATAVEFQGVTFRLLGPINVRGRAEPCTVYQLEWREEQPSDFLTMQGDLEPGLLSGERDALGRDIQLTWMDVTKTFKAFDLPIGIGRVKSAEFVVNDPRVSRSNAPVLLRREECVLHGEGELALGASFSDISVPTVGFVVR